MSEANKEEIEKCKQIAQAALAAGDAEKASRILQKAKRMCPTDTSIDDLLAKAASGAGGSSPNASPSPGGPGARAPDPTASEGPRQRASASSNVRTTKDGKQYTSEQMQLVQRILRTKDYYDILEVPKNANEEVAKKAYRKLALKLHPDKNGAPGADEAFKKLSKAFQCLTDPEKKQVYDTYGDEERMPQQQRHHYQQDFMTPEDLFNAFFGGGPAFHQHHGARHRHHHHDDGQMQRVQIFQALPVLLLVLLTLASNFAAKDGGSKFSFQPNNAYRNERSTATLNVAYYVTDDFEEHYNEGTRNLAEFDRQVEIYHIRSLHSDCDYQEKTQYKKVLAAKRRGSQEDLQAARNHPRPACKELERVKKKFPALFRSAMFMGGY